MSFWSSCLDQAPLFVPSFSQQGFLIFAQRERERGRKAHVKEEDGRRYSARELLHEERREVRNEKVDLDWWFWLFRWVSLLQSHTGLKKIRSCVCVCAFFVRLYSQLFTVKYTSLSIPHVFSNSEYSYFTKTLVLH